MLDYFDSASMVKHSDIPRRTVVGYEILHVPEDVRVAFVQGFGHGS